MCTELVRTAREGKRGFVYEDQVLTHLAIICATNKNIKDFIITGNAGDFGNVDDVVLDLIYSDDTREVLALQIKHKTDAKKLFGTKGVFADIQKYRDSYDMLKEKYPLKVILWTTFHFEPKDWQQYESKHIIMQDFNVGGKIYKLNNAYFQKFGITLNEDFLESCFLFTSQPDSDNIKNVIGKDLGQHIFNETCNDIFSNIGQAEACNYNRRQIVQVLIYLILKPYLSYYTKSTEYRLNFMTIITAIVGSTITIKNPIAEEKLLLAVSQYIQNYCGLSQNEAINWDEKLPKNIIEKIIKDANKLRGSRRENAQLLKNHMEKNENLCYKDLHYMMWIIGAIPLIVNYTNTTKTQYDFLKNKFAGDELFTNLVLVCKDEVSPFAGSHVWQNYDTRKIKFSFKPNFESTLHDLVDRDENVLKTITPDVYLNLMGGLNQINRNNSLCEDYMTRQIKIIVFQKCVLEEKTVLFAVHEEVQDAVDLNLYIKEYEENRAQFNLKYKNVNILYSKDSQFLTSKKMLKFEKPFCCLWEFKGDYICYAGDDQTINVLAEYRSFRNYLISERELCENNFPIDLCVVSANAGMGKSELLLSIQKEASQHLWPIYLNLGKHATELDKLKDSPSSLLDYLVDIEVKQELLKDFYKQLMQNRLNKRRVLLLLDGYDEVQLKEWIITQAARLKFRIIISSRNFKMQELQKRFHTLPFELEIFNWYEKEEYFRRRYKNFNDDLIRDMLLNLNEHISEEIIGIPLQLKHFVDLCDTREKYEEIKDRVDVLYLYEEFFKKHIPECKDLLESEVQELATKLLIQDKNLLEDLVIDDTRVEKVAAHFQNKRKKEFIITGFTSDNIPIFIHQTYAEFACAQLLFSKRERKHFLSAYEDLHKREELFQVRYFFNLLTCRQAPLHFAILNKNKGIDHALKYIQERDCLGRNILHLICGFAETSFSVPNITVRNRWYYFINADRLINPFGVNENILNYILDKIIFLGLEMFLQPDEFRKYPWDYSFHARSLDLLDFICAKTNTTIPPIDSSHPTFTIFYIIIRFHLNHLLNSSFENHKNVLTNHNNLIRSVLSENDVKKTTPQYILFKQTNILHVATFYQNLEAVRMFLEIQNIDINCKDSINFETSLHLIFRSKVINMELLKMFLNHPNLDVNISDVEGDTALLLICSHSEGVNLEALQMLCRLPTLEYNCKNVEDWNALHFLCFRIHDDPNKVKALKMLLDIGKINVNSKNLFDMTPLQIICSYDGADIHLEALALLLEQENIDVNVSANKKTILHNLCWPGIGYKPNFAAIKMVLSRSESIDINAKNDLGMTPLHCLCRSPLDLNLSIFALLTTYKNIDLNCKDNDNMTVMHYLCIPQSNTINVEAIQFSMKFNIEFNSRDIFGKRPVDYLPEKYKSEVEKIFNKERLNS